MKFNNLIKKHWIFPFLIMILVLAIPFLLNIIHGEPLIKGAESYYHLTQSKENEPFYLPLAAIQKVLPLEFIAIIPPVFAICSFFLFIRICKQSKLDHFFILFFLGLLFLSPVFIFTFTTISFYSLFIVLILLAFNLLLLKNKIAQLLSIVPFAALPFYDLLHSLLAGGLLLLYYFRTKEKTSVITLGVLCVSMLINWLSFSRTFIRGPFSIQYPLSGFFSDLGALRGISIFVILLAVIGLCINWKRKKLLTAYVSLPLLFILYIFKPQTLFLFSLPIIAFSAMSFKKLLDRQWSLPSLKKITLFLVMLGLVFSTVSYLERITEIGPSAEEIQALRWIEDNTQSSQIVFSDIEEVYFIRYFAERQVIGYPHEKNIHNKTSSFEEIFSARYIQELFPLLEEQEISVLFITEEMKKELPQEEGLLFLFKNERFKLAYASEKTEVWFFEGVY